MTNQPRAEESLPNLLDGRLGGSLPGHPPTDPATPHQDRVRPHQDRLTPNPEGSLDDSTSGTTSAARAEDLVKVYGSGATAVRALDGVYLRIERHKFTAIMGPSGSGKSTLLHCLAGLDTPTSGRVWIGDTETTNLSDNALTKLRREQVGFVFQSFNLLPTLTAEQNLMLPLELAGRAVDSAWLQNLVTTLGLSDRLHHRPTELSGGQQQRVAIARALLSRPALVVADEPTGNLDSASGAEVLSLLRTAVRGVGQSVVMVTHDPIVAAYADRVVLLADGRLNGVVHNPTVDSVRAALTGAR